MNICKNQVLERVQVGCVNARIAVLEYELGILCLEDKETYEILWTRLDCVARDIRYDISGFPLLEQRVEKLEIQIFEEIQLGSVQKRIFKLEQHTRLNHVGTQIAYDLSGEPLLVRTYVKQNLITKISEKTCSMTFFNLI